MYVWSALAPRRLISTENTKQSVQQLNVESAVRVTPTYQYQEPVVVTVFLLPATMKALSTR